MIAIFPHDVTMAEKEKYDAHMDMIHRKLFKVDQTWNFSVFCFCKLVSSLFLNISLFGATRLSISRRMLWGFLWRPSSCSCRNSMMSKSTLFTVVVCLFSGFLVNIKTHVVGIPLKTHQLHPLALRIQHVKHIHGCFKWYMTIIPLSILSLWNKQHQYTDMCMISKELDFFILTQKYQYWISYFLILGIPRWRNSYCLQFLLLYVSSPFSLSCFSIGSMQTLSM